MWLTGKRWLRGGAGLLYKTIKNIPKPREMMMMMMILVGISNYKSRCLQHIMPNPLNGSLPAIRSSSWGTKIVTRKRQESPLNELCIWYSGSSKSLLGFISSSSIDMHFCSPVQAFNLLIYLYFKLKKPSKDTLLHFIFYALCLSATQLNLDFTG